MDNLLSVIHSLPGFSLQVHPDLPTCPQSQAPTRHDRCEEQSIGNNLYRMVLRPAAAGTSGANARRGGKG